MSGLFEAANMFSAAGKQRDQAQQYRLKGQQALAQGIEIGRDITREGADVLGSMTTAFGKSGTLLEGSPLLALADTQTQIERNIARAIEQGRIAKADYDRQAEAAAKAARGSQLGAIAKIAGVVAAPFTGGASLLISGAATGMMGR